MFFKETTQKSCGFFSMHLFFCGCTRRTSRKHVENDFSKIKCFVIDRIPILKLKKSHLLDHFLFLSIPYLMSVNNKKNCGVRKCVYDANPNTQWNHFNIKIF